MVDGVAITANDLRSTIKCSVRREPVVSALFMPSLLDNGYYLTPFSFGGRAATTIFVTVAWFFMRVACLCVFIEAGITPATAVPERK
jgi:hypothetical protein